MLEGNCSTVSDNGFPTILSVHHPADIFTVQSFFDTYALAATSCCFAFVQLLLCPASGLCFLRE